MIRENVITVVGRETYQDLIEEVLDELLLEWS